MTTSTTTTVTHTEGASVVSSIWGQRDTFRVATISPAVDGFRVFGYINGEDYIGNREEAQTSTESYARALVLARGYVTEAFSFCPDCEQCVAYEDESETWCHLAPAPTCYLSFTNGGN